MRRYTILLLGVTLGIVLCSVGISVTLDPYRVVHPLVGQMVLEPNSRASKLRYLFDACREYNAYYVGSSRSGPLTQQDLAIAGANLKFYNFWTPADTPPAIVPRVKWLLDRGCPLSALVVEESANSLPDLPGDVDRSLMLSESPRISGESWFAFYSRYFLSAQSLMTYASVRTRSGLHRTYYADGHVEYLWSLHDNGALLQPCHAPSYNSNRLSLLDSKLAAYRELAGLAALYHFTIVVWIAPMNRAEATEVLADPQVAGYLRELRSIAHLSVVEPDWTSPMMADYRAWHDCGHFRPEVFDQLLAPGVTQALRASLSDVVSR